jgi:hypothetical protein
LPTLALRYGRFERPHDEFARSVVSGESEAAE